jgi:predicted transcriptional regulator YheO
MNTQALRKQDPMNEFTLEEAVSLIYRHAVLKKNAEKSITPDITQIGHICGVLALNDQIEIVIKFHDDLKQFTKQEFEAELKLLDR